MRVILNASVVIAATMSIGFAGAARADEAAALSSFDTRVLETQNAERVRVGAPPLAWDATLAKSAESWAKELARTSNFDHQKQDAEGENLWMGTVAAFQPEEMVDGWVQERKFFMSGRFPDVSTTKEWSDVGHYTQLIWKTTTRVGCAKVANAENDFLVCRYSPPGNWIGVEIRNDSSPKP
jgi:Cysteine-rich secretory protein family